MDDLDVRLTALARSLGAGATAPRADLDRRLARRRQRRRVRQLRVAGSACVVAIGLAVFLATGGRHSRVRTISAPSTTRPIPLTHTLLVVDPGSDRVTVVDVDAGSSRTVTLPGKVAGDFPYLLLVAGDRVVYPGTDGVRSLPASLRGKPVVLGSANTVVPSARRGWVWLISTPATPNASSQVQEVRSDGGARGAVHHLPSGLFAYVGVPGGLIIGDGSTFAVWNAASGRRGPTHFEGSGLIDVQGNQVAWGTGCGRASTCTSLRVEDVATGRVVVHLPAPRGTTGWIPTAGEASRDAFAAGGRYLAVRVGGRVTVGATMPATSSLYLVDQRTGIAREVPGSTSDYAFSRVAWSPDGSWVFFERPDHTTGAYRPTDGAVRTVATPCCGAALVALPAP